MIWDHATLAQPAPAPPPSHRRLRKPRRLVIELGRGRFQVVAERDTDELEELEHNATAALVAAETRHPSCKE